MNITDSYVTIMVKNMDRSIEFYQSIGFSLKQRWGDHYAQLKAQGIVIGLHPATLPADKTGSGTLSIGFTTDDIESTVAELAASGISTMARTESGGTFLHFSDPDGTALYFIQPKL